MVPSNSKHNLQQTKETLPEEIERFMSRNFAIVYISFGSTVTPSDETLTKIIEAVKIYDGPGIGFLMSLKKDAPLYTTIQEMNISNLHLSDWLPQK